MVVAYTKEGKGRLMLKTEVQKLKHGIYRVYWKESWGDGSSVCAVGSKYNGDRWLCCSNWTSPAERGTDSFCTEIWDAVLKMEIIATE